MGRRKTVDEIHADETKFVALCDLLKSLAVCAVIVFLIYEIIEMIPVVLSAKPETLDSFAKCLSEWSLSKIIFAIAAAIFGGGWAIEHHRNNKLVKRNGEIRHEVESRDSVSSRSGLDSIGRTPKE